MKITLKKIKVMAMTPFNEEVLIKRSKDCFGGHRSFANAKARP